MIAAVWLPPLLHLNFTPAAAIVMSSKTATALCPVENQDNVVHVHIYKTRGTVPEIEQNKNNDIMFLYNMANLRSLLLRVLLGNPTAE